MQSVIEAINAAISERLSFYGISQIGTIERDIGSHVLDSLSALGMVVVPREPTPEMLEAVKPWPAHWPKEGPDFRAMWAAYQTDQLAFQSQWDRAISTALKAQDQR